MDGHVVDRGSRFGAERVPRNTPRERGKPVVVRDAHDDPLDDVGMSQDTDIHERGAPRVDALEREQGVSTTATDNRKQRDVVASDRDNDRVVDQRGYAVLDVDLQKTPACVDDSLWSAAESLGSLDSFERLPEADNSVGHEKARLTVESIDCFNSSLFRGCVCHTDLLSRWTLFHLSYGTIVHVSESNQNTNEIKKATPSVCVKHNTVEGR